MITSIAQKKEWILLILVLSIVSSTFFVLFPRGPDDEYMLLGMRVGDPFVAVTDHIPPDAIIHHDKSRGQYVFQSEKKQWIFSEEGLQIEIKTLQSGSGINEKVKVGAHVTSVIEELGNPNGSFENSYVYRFKSSNLYIALENDIVTSIRMALEDPDPPQRAETTKEDLQQFYSAYQESLHNYIEQLSIILAQYEIHFINQRAAPDKNLITTFDLYRKMHHELQVLKPPAALKRSHELLTLSYQEELKKIEAYEDYLSNRITHDQF